LNGVSIRDGQKRLRICLLISTEQTNVADAETDTARWRRSRSCIASWSKN